MLKSFIFLFTCFPILHSLGQNVYIDTVSYEGTIILKNEKFRFKRIKSVVGDINNNFNVYDPELKNPEDETLLLFDRNSKCVLTFKLNETLADHNNATIMETDCLVTDSSLKLTRFNFWWASYPVDFPVGIEYYEYGINHSGGLYLKDSSTVISINSSEKLKLSKSENLKFRQRIKKVFNKEIDRQKMYDFLE